MPRALPAAPPNAAELALRLTQALSQERIVPRFVDSYVVEHSRHALQVHATLYRELLGLLQREALLAAVMTLLAAVCEGPSDGKKQFPLKRKDAAAFRKKFLLALARERNWNAGDSLDFQSDLQLYEDVLSQSASSRRGRKPFEGAHHPFVDRCAFLLDSSFMEKARVAATHTLAAIEELTTMLAHDAWKHTAR
jgi:hypothetical protein